MDTAINLVIFLFTAAAFILSFRNKEGIWSLASGLRALRFFTILSNVLCACVSLAVAITFRHGSMPYGIWLLKYIGTASVTVTFLTVMVFLGPTLGYKDQLKSWGLFLHLIGPLLAVISFCFLERAYPLSFSLSLLGILPVALYGVLYLYKVVLSPEEHRWEDFYGFNKNGNWKISFSAMVVGAFLVCVILWLLCRI